MHTAMPEIHYLGKLDTDIYMPITVIYSITQKVNKYSIVKGDCPFKKAYNNKTLARHLSRICHGVNLA